MIFFFCTWKAREYVLFCSYFVISHVMPARMENLIFHLWKLFSSLTRLSSLVLWIFLLKFIVCCCVFFPSLSLLLEYSRFWIFPIYISPETSTRVWISFFSSSFCTANFTGLICRRDYYFSLSSVLVFLTYRFFFNISP